MIIVWQFEYSGRSEEGSDDYLHVILECIFEAL